MNKKSLFCCLMILGTSTLRADIKLPAIFSDHMVLQQGIKIPVWGWADPGEAVTVKLGNKSAQTTADPTGKWRVDLENSATVSKPQTMTIRGKNILKIEDVLVGEVWVCSGQSNMGFSLWHVNNAQDEINNAKYPKIRMFVTEMVSRPLPQENCSGRWLVCKPEEVGVQGFSAVGYFFARELHRNLKRPIGMLHSSVGATDAELWISLAGLKQLPQFQTEVKKAEAYGQEFTEKQGEYPAAMSNYEKQLAEATKAQNDQEVLWRTQIDAEDQGIKEQWMLPGKFSGGADLKLPDDYSHPALGSYLGSVWCRKEVKIPDAWIGKPLELHLGIIDETDDSYVNGQKVGSIWFDVPGFSQKRRVYSVHASLITSNAVSVTVRMVNRFGELGLFGPENEMSLVCKEGGGTPVALSGTWSYKKALEWKNSDIPKSVPKPKEPWGTRVAGSYFNGMIHPLIPYGIRGAIWYQGENNSARPDPYQELLPGLIASWRTAWGEGNFPFYIVQIANFGKANAAVEKKSMAELREVQASTARTVPNAGMAVTLDGVAEGHPTDKAIVGRRLGLQALAKTYGKDLPCEGPTYQGMKAGGNLIRLSFQFADGLQTRPTPNTMAMGNKVAGFSIAGADKVFHLAQARIDGQTVVVWSDNVSNPVAVRYAWANNPLCSLYNAAGLPLVSFRTDQWSPAEITMADENPPVP